MPCMPTSGDSFASIAPTSLDISLGANGENPSARARRMYFAVRRLAPMSAAWFSGKYGV